MCHLYEQLRHWLRRARVKTNICLPLPSMPPSNLPTHRRHRNLPDFATQMLAGMPKSEPRYILFPLILLEMFLQLNWSPPVINSIDWTWLGIANTGLYKVHQLTVHVRANSKPWEKELSADLRNRIVKLKCWQVCPKVSRGTFCFHWYCLRCFYNLIGVHLW